MTGRYLYLLLSTLGLLRVEAAENPIPKNQTLILVHGIWDNHHSFTYLRKRLENAGYRCLAPDLKPANGWYGLPDLSEKLNSFIETELGSTEHFSIIAFSMGGIVSRHYLQHYSGISRCDRFITISSPHNGTWTAYLHPGKAAAQMKPRSPFLRQLQKHDDQLSHIPCYSYRTPLDLIIFPSKSSIWTVAKNRTFLSLAHPLMILNKRVADSILHDLAQHHPQPLSP